MTSLRRSIVCRRWEYTNIMGALAIGPSKGRAGRRDRIAESAAGFSTCQGVICRLALAARARLEILAGRGDRGVLVHCLALAAEPILLLRQFVTSFLEATGCQPL